jgi:uncharacterized lipoprotein YmbA
MRKLWFILIAALFLTACAPRYNAALLSSIEGRWMCDVQRYTFETQQDIQAELDGRLSGNGVSAEQYRAFKDDLTKQQHLRDEVKAAYIQQCGT